MDAPTAKGVRGASEGDGMWHSLLDPGLGRSRLFGLLWGLRALEGLRAVSTQMAEYSTSCPCKVNLFLAVTGRRADGYHDLVSLVCQTSLTDTLALSAAEEDGPATLDCSDAAIGSGPDNLVLKAAALFRETTQWRRRVHFTLQKAVPSGAGLGGGSSNAAGALRLLVQASGRNPGAETLAGMAAALGSDVPLFLSRSPSVIRGRGERVEKLGPAATGWLDGIPLLIVKPHFGIPTPWAYSRLAAGAPDSYLASEEAERRLTALLAGGRSCLGRHLFNSFEAPVFGKFPALPAMVDEVRTHCGLPVLMSGSGSACLVLASDRLELADARRRVREAWGPGAFIREACLLGGADPSNAVDI